MIKSALILTAVVVACSVAWWIADPLDPIGPGSPTERVTERSEVPEVDPEPAPRFDSTFVASEIVESTSSQVDVDDGAGTIEGLVRGPWGDPAPGSRVTLWRVQLPTELAADSGVHAWRLLARAPGQARPTLENRYPNVLQQRAAVVADENGHFEFGRIADGEYLVAAAAPEMLTTPLPMPIALGLGPDPIHQATADVVLREAHTLLARVLDARDASVADASVRLTGNLLESDDGIAQSFLSLGELFLYRLNAIERTAITDSDGWVEILGLPELEYQLIVSAPLWAASETLHVVPLDDPIEIVLEAGGAVLGTVEDENGESVAEAAVELIVEQGKAAGSQFLEEAREPVRTTTGESGEFRFDAVPTGVYRVAVTHPGHRAGGAKGVRVSPGSEAEVLVQLEVGAVVAGVVMSDDGAPVADTEVTVSLNPRQVWRVDLRAKSDAEGRFRFDTLGTGKVRLEFRHPDWAPHSLEATPDGEELEVVLGAGRSLVGQVVDGTGAPIPSPSVWLTRRGERTRSTKTDEEGRFRFTGLGPDGYELSAQASGYLTYRESLEPTVDDVEQIVLESAPLIIGVVSGPDQRPLAGARVVARQADSGNRRAATANSVSRHDGTFEVSLPVADASWFVSAEYPMMLAIDGPERVVRAGAEEVIDVELGWGAGLRGLVVDRGGVPVARVRVALVPEVERRGRAARNEVSTRPLRVPRPGRGRRAGSTRSRADGHFQISGLEPGRYRLEATADGFAPERVGGIELLEGRIDDRDIVLQDERVLHGHVRDIAGLAIPGARVQVSGGGVGGTRETTAAADGYYEIGGLGEAEIQVRVSAADHLSWASGRLTVGAQAFDIVLDASHDVFGEVVDRATGLAWPGVSVHLREHYPDEPRRRTRSRTVRVDDNGSFEFEGIPAGDYWLTLNGGGAVSSVVGLVRVPRDIPRRGLLFRLERGAVLGGRILAAGGGGVAKANVRVFLLTERDGKSRADQVHRTQSDAEGRFEIDGVADGEYRVRIEHSAYLAETIEPVHVSAQGAESFLVRTLELGASVSGRVVQQPGTEGGNVTAECSAPKFRRTVKVDADSRFRIEGLPPGEYRVWHQPQGRRERRGERAVTLRAGQSLEVIVTGN